MAEAKVHEDDHHLFSNRRRALCRPIWDYLRFARLFLIVFCSICARNQDGREGFSVVFAVASSVLYIENKSWLLRGHRGITAEKKEGVQCRGMKTAHI